MKIILTVIVGLVFMLLGDLLAAYLWMLLWNWGVRASWHMSFVEMYLVFTIISGACYAALGTYGVAKQKR